MRVCLIDDEEDILLLLAELLVLLGHSSETFTHCEQALAAIQNGNPFDLMINDKRFADGMSGLACAEKLAELKIKTPLVLMTGDGAEPSRHGHSLPKNIRAILAKPFGLAELRTCIDSIFEPSLNAD